MVKEDVARHASSIKAFTIIWTSEAEGENKKGDFKKTSEVTFDVCLKNYDDTMERQW